MAEDESPGTTRFRLKFGQHRLKSLRLDRPGDDPGAKEAPTERSTRSPDAVRLLDLIRQAIQRSSRSGERRSSKRHQAVDRQIWIGWWEGDDFGVVDAKLVDLSRTGARVETDLKPPRREPIWFYKESGDSIATVRAHVVRRDVAPNGGFTVRFRFAAECPTFFCQAVLCKQPPRKHEGRIKIVPPN